jgi:hypothetical protein
MVDAEKLNCTALRKEIAASKKRLEAVQDKRSLITTNDITGFIIDFGASNYYAGSIAEENAQGELRTLQPVNSAHPQAFSMRSLPIVPLRLQAPLPVQAAQKVVELAKKS